MRSHKSTRHKQLTPVRIHGVAGPNDPLNDESREVTLTVGELKSLAHDIQEGAASAALEAADVAVRPEGLFEDDDDAPITKMKHSSVFAKPAPWEDSYSRDEVNFVKALAEGGDTYRAYLAQRAVLVGTPSDGTKGEDLIPEQFLARVVSTAAELSELAKLVHVQTVTSADGKIPCLTRPTMGWVAEAGVISESTPTAEKIAYRLHACKGLAVMSSELLEDAGIDLVSELATLFGSALADELDLKFSVGSGSGEPLGIYAVSGADELGTGMQSYAVGGALSYTALVAGMFSLSKRYRKGAVWLGSESHLQAVVGLLDNNNNPIFSSPVEGGPPKILGHNFVVQEDVAASQLLFGNPQGYTAFKRAKPPRIEVLSEGSTASYNFGDEDLRAFRIVERIDGRLRIHESFTRLTGIS